MANEADKVVSVVVPINSYFEGLSEFISGLHTVLGKSYRFFEVVVVDVIADARMGIAAQQFFNSELQKKNNLRYLRLRQKGSLDLAFIAGLETAIGDIIVMMDPACDPIDQLPALIEQCSSQNELLYGVNRSVVDGPFHRIFSKAFYYSMNRFAGIEVQPRGSNFRIIPRQLANRFLEAKIRSQNIRVIFSSLSIPSQVFEYNTVTRHSSKLKSDFFEDLTYIFDVMVATSDHPLRWLGRFSLAASAFNLLYCVYVVLTYLFKKNVVQGWAATAMQISVMFFLLFIILMILSEYIGKILFEARQTPLYHLLEEKSSSVLLTSKEQLNIYKD